NYTLKGTFTLMKPSGHTNYYGLVFGGSDLEGAQQKYLYFLVAQNGTWLIKRRDGETTTDVAPKTASEAVKKPDASGKSTNVLEAQSRNMSIVHEVPADSGGADDVCHHLRMAGCFAEQQEGRRCQDRSNTGHRDIRGHRRVVHPRMSYHAKELINTRPRERPG